MKASKTLWMAAMAALCAGAICAQTPEEIQQARRLRADAAYLQMKGETAKAIEKYEASLKFIQDETIARKVAELKGTPAPVASAARNLAGEVYAKLDLDAFALFYLNAESLVAPLREEMIKLLNVVAQASAGEGATDGLPEQAMGSVDPVMDWLGLYAIRAAGASLAPLDSKISRVTSVVLLDEKQRDRALWRLCGKPVAMDTMKFMPADTVMAGAGSVGLGTVWSIVREGVGQFAPQAVGMLDAQLNGLKEGMGIDVDALLASLADEMFFALTLSSSTTVSIPMPNDEPLDIPEPGLLIGLKVTDSSVQDALLGFLRNSGMPVMEKAMGEAMIYSMNLPAPLPFTVQPAMTVLNNTLLIGSSPTLLERAAASYEQGGALLASDDFKTCFGERPAQISGMSYASQRFYKEYCRLNAAMTLAGMGDSEEMAKYKPVMDYLINMIGKDADDYHASYQVSDADGIMSVTRMKTPTDNPLVSSLSSLMTMGVFFGLTAAEKAAEQAKITTCIMNQNMIESAKQQWAMEQNAAEDAQPTWEDLMPYFYDGQAPVCPAGGEYTIGTMNEQVSCSIEKHFYAPPSYEEEISSETDFGEPEYGESEEGVEEGSEEYTEEGVEEYTEEDSVEYDEVVEEQQ